MKKTFSEYGLIGMMAAVGLTSLVMDAAAQPEKYEARAKTLTTANKASEIIGMDVYNAQNEKLGKVDDLIVDWSAGRIRYAVLSSGGILGVGDKLVAVPASSFSYVAGEKKLLLDADKQSLKEAPQFSKSEWPDMNNPTWDASIRRHYEAKGYYKKDRVRGDADRDTELDNTRRNVRDRDNKTLTPEDQGRSEADRTTTQQIRKSLVNDESLSTVSKNVKIITANGTVTLRGVVKTEQEKADIAAKAKKFSDNVDNQLEVKGR